MEGRDGGPCGESGVGVAAAAAPEEVGDEKAWSAAERGPLS